MIHGVEHGEALALILAFAKKGGGGGSTNYNVLSNKPKIHGVTLQNDKTAQELFLVATDPKQNAWWFDKHGHTSQYVKSMNGQLVSAWAEYVADLKTIIDADHDIEDVFIPYKTGNSCLVFEFNPTSNDVVMRCYCYSIGKQIIVSKYTDSEGKERYRVKEVDFAYLQGQKWLQATATNKWVITHNLDTYPHIFLYNEDGELLIPQNIIFVDDNTINVLFSEPVKGYAILN